MITIHLHNLLFYAHHGIYEEESRSGSNYEVNLDVKFDEPKKGVEGIDDTVNYEDLFAIVKKKMSVRANLVENVCESIIRNVQHQYKTVKEVSVTIYKLEAPIENLQGKVGVTMRKKFDD